MVAAPCSLPQIDMDSLMTGQQRRRYPSDDSTSVSEGGLEVDVLRPLGAPLDKVRFPLSPRSEQAYDAITCEFDALFDQLCQSPPFGPEADGFAGFGLPANGAVPAAAPRGRPRKTRAQPDSGLGGEPAAKVPKTEAHASAQPPHLLSLRGMSLPSAAATSTPIEPIAPGSVPIPTTSAAGGAALKGSTPLNSVLQNNAALSELLLAAAVHANRTDGRGAASGRAEAAAAAGTSADAATVTPGGAATSSGVTPPQPSTSGRGLYLQTPTTHGTQQHQQQQQQQPPGESGTQGQPPGSHPHGLDLQGPSTSGGGGGATNLPPFAATSAPPPGPGGTHQVGLNLGGQVHPVGSLKLGLAQEGPDSTPPPPSLTTAT